MLSTSKGATQRNLQTRSKIKKKTIGTPNQSIKVRSYRIGEIFLATVLPEI
jgi:hypothetical protein